MAASKDLCTVSEKPFYGKQKSIGCGGCDVHFHCVCLKINDMELAFYTTSGKSSYKCTACIKLQKATRMDNKLIKM
jgi:hypothetical protein